MMPEMDGITALAKLRQVSNVPVILLTAKSEDTDKILGLNVGADDYVTKPFNPVEVAARVRSQLRRYFQLGGGNLRPEVLALGGIQMDDREKAVTLDGDPVPLTPTEYDILKLLLEHPGQVFSPKEIYRKVWKDAPFGSENTVAVHIRHLREKLEIDPAEPRYLKVVWGQGYKLEKGMRNMKAVFVNGNMEQDIEAGDSPGRWWGRTAAPVPERPRRKTKLTERTAAKVTAFLLLMVMTAVTAGGILGAAFLYSADVYTSSETAFKQELFDDIAWGDGRTLLGLVLDQLGTGVSAGRRSGWTAIARRKQLLRHGAGYDRQRALAHGPCGIRGPGVSFSYDWEIRRTAAYQAEPRAETEIRRLLRNFPMEPCVCGRWHLARTLSMRRR